jgi:glutamate--cysteine ligase
MASYIDRHFERRLGALINAREPRVLLDGLKGVEKESLRVRADGHLALTDHPYELGSALTSAHITTDFSESLIELVTPTFRTSAELLAYLRDLHQFVYRNLGDELLWATSMPCRVSGDDAIPVARYGNSNVGRMKTVYREGLRHRYGALMQAISGVHFNYSFPALFWDVYAQAREAAPGQQFVSQGYFELLRNYRRLGWIVLYLFGTSPAADRSFLASGQSELPWLDADTAYEPFGTSLRMSDIGYRNRNQADVQVSLNGVDEYARDLRRATEVPYPAYEQLGVRVDGHWRQLNSNLLQIENEYYSFIRPKRVTRPGERPSAALRRAGVEYVEVRALDVSAYDPVGVNQNKLRFIEAFLALCVLRDSPPMDDRGLRETDDNHLRVARRGREPGLMLQRDGRAQPLHSWAREILDAMEGVCELLDTGDPARPYAQALRAQRDKVDDVAATPSARLLAELRRSGESFADLALRMSLAHKAYFLSLHPPDVARLAQFRREADESLAEQRGLESTQREVFEVYLDRYFSAT